jgi:hypothetical protein
MAAATRDLLGEERLAWLPSRPVQLHGPAALVHASPESLWRAPVPDVPNTVLEQLYGPLVRHFAVCGTFIVPISGAFAE